MTKTKLLLIATASSIAVSCDNPADTTADASVSDAKSVAQAAPEAQAYVFTPDSEINFIGSKVTESHPGGFKSFEGGFKLVDQTPVSGSFTIDMDSTWSDSERLTGHLKNEDFFNVSAHPTTTFEVTEFEKVEDMKYNVSGNLTLVGVTKNITFPATVSGDLDKISLVSEFDIKRKDWGIVYPGMPDNLIRNEVVIQLNLHAVPAE